MTFKTELQFKAQNKNRSNVSFTWAFNFIWKRLKCVGIVLWASFRISGLDAGRPVLKGFCLSRWFHTSIMLTSIACSGQSIADSVPLCLYLSGYAFTAVYWLLLRHFPYVKKLSSCQIEAFSKIVFSLTLVMRTATQQAKNAAPTSWQCHHLVWQKLILLDIHKKYLPLLSTSKEKLNTPKRLLNHL